MSFANKPIIIIGVLFFVFGFMTWLGSVLIPYFKIACQLTNLESYLVAFSFYISYMVMAVPSGWLLRFTGYKKGMSLGLFYYVHRRIFICALRPMEGHTPCFSPGYLCKGTGLAILQTASNPYITILGPLDSAARRISIMGVCNGVAGAIAPIVLGAVTLRDADGIKTRIATMPMAQALAELKRIGAPRNYSLQHYGHCSGSIIHIDFLFRIAGIKRRHRRTRGASH